VIPYVKLKMGIRVLEIHLTVILFVEMEDLFLQKLVMMGLLIIVTMIQMVAIHLAQGYEQDGHAQEVHQFPQQLVLKIAEILES